MDNVNADFLTKWFTGKSLVKAQEAMTLLNDSLKATYWLNRGAQKVPAALSKSNVGRKLGDAIESFCKKDLGYTFVPKYEGMTPSYYNHPVYELSSPFQYGKFQSMCEIDMLGIMESVTSLDAKAFVAKGMEYAADFKPVADAIKYLNEESESNKQLTEAFDAKNPVGQCACCFRVQKVKPDGTMFKHGFQRPGDGEIYNECEGYRFKPYRLPKGA
jgi:hypothetical protein